VNLVERHIHSCLFFSEQNNTNFSNTIKSPEVDQSKIIKIVCIVVLLERASHNSKYFNRKERKVFAVKVFAY
jgi:hypothetical protein